MIGLFVEITCQAGPTARSKDKVNGLAHLSTRAPKYVALMHDLGRIFGIDPAGPRGIA